MNGDQIFEFIIGGICLVMFVLSVACAIQGIVR